MWVRGKQTQRVTLEGRGMGVPQRPSINRRTMPVWTHNYRGSGVGEGGLMETERVNMETGPNIKQVLHFTHPCLQG
jgi:hypothetical protein